MSKKKTVKTRNYDYPAETEGSRLAAENRKKMNAKSPEELEELYELAQRLMHGDPAKSKVGS